MIFPINCIVYMNTKKYSNGHGLFVTNIRAAEFWRIHTLIVLEGQSISYIWTAVTASPQEYYFEHFPMPEVCLIHTSMEDLTVQAFSMTAWLLFTILKDVASFFISISVVKLG